MLTEADRSELLTVKEAASLLRLHPMTIRKKIAADELPALQPSGPRSSVRIDASELEDWLHRERVSGAAIARRSPAGPAARDGESVSASTAKPSARAGQQTTENDAE